MIVSQALREKKLRTPFALAIAFLLAVLLEFFVFNHAYWFMPQLPQQEVTLPQAADGQKGVLLTETQPTASLSRVSLNANSVEICAMGAPGIQKFGIYFTDAVNTHQLVPAATAVLNPGGSRNCARAEIVPKGNIQNFAIRALSPSQGNILITQLLFNPTRQLEISWLRFWLTAFCLMASAAAVSMSLWRENFDKASRLHQGLSFLVLLAVVSLSFAVTSWEGNAKGEKSFIFTNGSILQLTSEDGQLAQPLPVGESLAKADIYTQLFSAFHAGQFHLQLDSDPGLLKLKNPYDASERAAAGVNYYWDHAWKDGKYYCYFGPAPLLTAYLPVWLLTGELPLSALAAGILAFWALLALYWAMQALVRFFDLKPNLLLFLLAEGAVLTGGTLTTMLQASVTFYYLPYLSAYLWLSVFIAALYASTQADTPLFRRMLLAVAGLSVVLIVLSRPLVVLFAMVFALPPLWRQVKEKQSSLRSLAGDILVIGTPVIIGAAGVMYYNYARFGNILEFGQYLQFTVTNIQANEQVMSLRNLAGMVNAFFLEPFETLREFPFIGLANPPADNAGNYLYSGPHAGMLQIPLFLGFLLAFFECRKNSDKKLLWLAAGSIVVTLIISYFAYNNAGVLIRYICDSTVAASLVAFLLIVKWVRIEARDSSGLALGGLASWLLLQTTAIGVLLTFSDENKIFNYLNPDAAVTLLTCFTPW